MEIVSIDKQTFDAMLSRLGDSIAQTVPLIAANRYHS